MIAADERRKKVAEFADEPWKEIGRKGVEGTTGSGCHLDRGNLHPDLADTERPLVKHPKSHDDR